VTFAQRVIAISSLLTLALHAAPGTVLAQSQRPYEGLFAGRASAFGTSKHDLDVSVSVAEAYDDNQQTESPGLTPGGPMVTGFYSMLLADAVYNWQGKRVQFGATGGAAVRYYNESDSLETGYTSGIGFTAEVMKRTTISLNQTIAYSPSHLYGLFPSVTTAAPGDAIPVAPDYAIQEPPSYVYGTTLSMSRGLTRRGTLSGSVDYQATDFTEETLNRRDISSYRAGVQFLQGFSRRASLRFGYQYRTGDFGYAVADSGKTTEHSFNVGVGYVRALSPTRRMTFSFGLGPSATDAPSLALAGVDSERHYGVRGDLAFAYKFNRTWETRASYEQGLQYVPEFARAVNSRGVSATLHGLFSRTMDFSAGVGYSTGAPVALQNTSTFDTYTANARVRQAITTKMAVYVEYLYYFYDFAAAVLPAGIPSSMERNGVRVGLTLWMPVLGR
jgi:hypothetical protein